PEGIFAAEAASLRWLRAAGAVPVPEVLADGDDAIVLEWVAPGAPSRAAARRLGAGLAALHAAGADGFGASWPAYLGSLRLHNEPAPTFAEFYAHRRLLPCLRLAVDRGGVTAADARAVEQVADRCADLVGPAEPPARVHGDLWSGNLHWAADGTCRLIDPAAYGGHRETDLAMLTLFGAPHLDDVLRAYTDAAADLGRPLPDNWRTRLPLHQLLPLLAHAALFGGGYGVEAGEAARSALLVG
ncbi:MAG: fructosamine kinase family protein, partial [Acidothermales bacterium]|nr:fructosamine kinase family protein [Acidothermales bacterium]